MKRWKTALSLFFGVLLLAGLAGTAWAAGTDQELGPPDEYEMKTERPAYDGNVGTIRYFITNKTAEESAFGMGYGLERKNGETWEAVPPKPGANLKVPDVANIMFPGQTVTGYANLDWVYAPLETGRYRITQSLGKNDTYCAEFIVPFPYDCLRLDEPVAAALTLNLDGKKGWFQVGEKESPQLVPELWHELLVFQEGDKPTGLAQSPAVQIRLTMKSAETVELDLYPQRNKVWALVEEKWYFVTDPAFLDRLNQMGTQLGAYLPATAGELLQALEKLEPLQDVPLTASRFADPFPYKGWRSDKAASGVELSVIQFPSAGELNEQMMGLSEDGYSIRAERRENGAIHYGPQELPWDAPPHFFKSGSRLVLYNGSEKKVIDALAGLLGPQINGGETIEKG